MRPNNLSFIPASEHLVRQMMPWFHNDAEIRQWSGPNFRYPYDATSFIADLQLTTLASYCLMDGEQLVAFGQFYERLGRLHLARLVVAPNFRQLGMSKHLITSLIEEGRQQLSTRQVSLFVLTQNVPALKCYQALGFKPKDYPNGMPIPDCLYLVLNLSD